MARTSQLRLPLLLPAQAQKHVTVNEALSRLDAVAQLRVVSSETALPPTSADDGVAYIVPAEATGPWQDRAGDVAVWSNGGWEFIRPKAGWRAWHAEWAASVIFDGQAWVPSAVAISFGGAATLQGVIEFDHVLAPGPHNATSTAIPAGVQVLGVTGRVVQALAGSGVAAWRLGVQESDNRYGAGLGVVENSYVLGLTGSPLTYYAETPLLLTAEGGSFSGGTVRLAIHTTSLRPPRPV